MHHSNSHTKFVNSSILRNSFQVLLSSYKIRYIELFSPTMPPQRSAISNTQKAALRTQCQLRPHALNKDLQQWFQSTYSQTISLSSISEILSSRYSYLDSTENPYQNSKRRRPECWPELEKALYKWIQQAEGYISITGDVIREKVQFFWKNLPAYEGKEMPTFSNSWLHNFQS